MNLWKLKLAAYLHDPPEKAYDFGPRHVERAKAHAASFGVADVWDHLTRNPDWSAAAADRFVFPSGQKLGRGLGEKTNPCFIHPISGRQSGPALPTVTLQFPSQADAEEWLGDIRPDWQSSDPQALFSRVWRQWGPFAAEHSKGTERGAKLLPYLPADTRIADGTIWHHCAVVSALESTRDPEPPNAPLKPAFLLFQVGPVQEFIGQARSTRDLWSGSYLLSWLTMHAIKAVADHLGPDAIIFPSLKGQPLYDFLEQKRLGMEDNFRNHQRAALEESVLVPGIPNRFLALVPAGFDVETIVAEAFRKEWRSIATSCRQWLGQHGVPFDDHHRRLWDEQVERHWQLTWHLQPWQSVDEALKAFRQVPLGQDNPIHLAKQIAQAIPDAHKDHRCYRDAAGRQTPSGGLDPGWAWSAHYQICQHALDARRSVRDFEGLATDRGRKPGHRDALSGREEAVIQEDVLEKAVARHGELKHLFRHIEPLGAANLVKRVWHKAHLARLHEVSKGGLTPLREARQGFESVPSVAAGAFARRLYELAGTQPEIRTRWIAFAEAASAAKDDYPDSIADFTGASEAEWHRRTDQGIYFPSAWQREQARRRQDGEPFHSPEALQRLAKAEQALHSLLKSAEREPSSYYAVLALDGDQIGKWLSGEKSPTVKTVISPDAAAYFREHLKGVDVEKWLNSPRPISPSWHLQFSEALANFGLQAARRIVEEVHHGQLIYSGGDDVLAMMPADEAIACATNLRAAFQGRWADMSPDCQDLFGEDAPDGFLRIAKPRKGEPSWPLLVPGPRMTVSVGIAIGHIKEPLQDMIAEAQRAEKRAKAPPERQVLDNRDRKQGKECDWKWKVNEGWDRDALAVSLFKRSGETIRWGAKFGSPARDLLRYFQTHYRQHWNNPHAETPISGKFPYRLAELLGRYGGDAAVTESLSQIAKCEVEFVISRQTDPKFGTEKDSSKPRFDRRAFQTACDTYLESLRTFSWERPASDGGTVATQTPRPLREFINLFLLEAFIRRQAD